MASGSSSRAALRGWVNSRGFAGSGSAAI